VSRDEGLFDERLFDTHVLTSPTAPGPGRRAPLAVRLRPRTLEEVVGQDHLLGAGAPLRLLVEGTAAVSVLLWGPPGTGKTTLARLVSQTTDRHFEALSALSAGVKEVRAVIDAARRRLAAPAARRAILLPVRCPNATGRQLLRLPVVRDDERLLLVVGCPASDPR